MRRYIRRYIPLFISFLLFSVSFHPILASRHAEYYAILIGIGENRDVERLYNALLMHDNWKENNMILLINKNATIENVSKAFENVSANSNENDYVFIFYMGHGVKIKDEDGDEKDGYDEGLTLQNGNMSDDLLGKMIDNISANAISIFLDCDFGNGIADDLKGDGKILFFSYGVSLYHVPTKFFIYEIKNSGDATFEKTCKITKIANNIFWLSLPFMLTFISTLLSISPAIISNFMLNMVRSIIQFFIDGIVGGISPLMCFVFFLITLKIYMPFFMLLNGLTVTNAISLIELLTFTKTKGFIFPFCNIDDRYEGDMPFLKD